MKEHFRYLIFLFHRGKFRLRLRFLKWKHKPSGIKSYLVTIGIWWKHRPYLRVCPKCSLKFWYISPCRYDRDSEVPCVPCLGQRVKAQKEKRNGAYSPNNN